mgnify:CR=1 FL=1
MHKLFLTTALILLPLVSSAEDGIESKHSCKIVDQRLSIFDGAKHSNYSGRKGELEVGDFIELKYSYYPNQTVPPLFVVRGTDQKKEHLTFRYMFTLSDDIHYIKNSRKYQYVKLIDEKTTLTYGEIRRESAQFGFVFDIGGLTINRDTNGKWFGNYNRSIKLKEKPIEIHTYSFICEQPLKDKWDTIFEQLLKTAKTINRSDECLQTADQCG